MRSSTVPAGRWARLSRGLWVEAVSEDGRKHLFRVLWVSVHVAHAMYCGLESFFFCLDEEKDHRPLGRGMPPWTTHSGGGRSDCFCWPILTGPALALCREMSLAAVSPIPWAYRWAFVVDHAALPGHLPQGER